MLNTVYWKEVGGPKENATASQFQAFLKFLKLFYPQNNMREKSVKNTIS